jgi:hypothetical protein
MEKFSAIAIVFLLTSWAKADPLYKLEGYDWSYQKNPVETQFVICNKDAPVGASKVIRQVAAKWNYSKLTIAFDPDNCRTKRRQIM